MFHWDTSVIGVSTTVLLVRWTRSETICFTNTSKFDTFSGHKYHLITILNIFIGYRISLTWLLRMWLHCCDRIRLLWQSWQMDARSRKQLVRMVLCHSSCWCSCIWNCISVIFDRSTCTSTKTRTVERISKSI